MIGYSGLVWRAVPDGADPLTPAAAPEGRFHRPGQCAIYTSLTPQGTAVAIARYVAPGDPARVIHPLHVSARHLADLRDEPQASAVWQDIRATGAKAPTWRFSDAARADGAQGLLYRSRSRPDLIHLVIFDASALRRTDDPAPLPWPGPARGKPRA